MEHSPSPKLHGRSTSEVPTKESMPLTQTASTASPWNTISTLQTKNKLRDIVTSTVLIPFSLTVANRTIASTTIPRSVQPVPSSSSPVDRTTKVYSAAASHKHSVGEPPSTRDSLGAADVDSITHSGEVQYIMDYTESKPDSPTRAPEGQDKASTVPKDKSQVEENSVNKAGRKLLKQQWSPPPFRETTPHSGPIFLSP